MLNALGTACEGTCPDGGQQSPGGVDGEARDAVVAAVWSVQRPARRRDLDLCAGILAVVAIGQGRYGLQRRQSTCIGVEVVRGDTATLLVREVEHVQARMKAVVSRARLFRGYHHWRRVRSETAGVLIEPELIDPVRSVGAGDVGDEGESVGRVSLHGVRARSGLARLERAASR